MTAGTGWGWRVWAGMGVWRRRVVAVARLLLAGGRTAAPRTVPPADPVAPLAGAAPVPMPLPAAPDGSLVFGDGGDSDDGSVLMVDLRRLRRVGMVRLGWPWQWPFAASWLGRSRVLLGVPGAQLQQGGQLACPAVVGAGGVEPEVELPVAGVGRPGWVVGLGVGHAEILAP